MRVTVFEAGARVGGKLRTSAVAGVPVDEAAELFLARRPEAVALARAVGLGADLVAPRTTSAWLWTRGRLRPLPRGTVLGVPADLGSFLRSGVLSAPGAARLLTDLVRPPTPLTGDVAVGDYVARRLGREAVDRLVAPLLGGVYAGRASDLSLDATAPQLSAAARRSRSLLRAARSVRRATPANPGPVFLTVRGGLGRFAATVAAASGATIRTGATIRSLQRGTDGWRLVVGSAADPREVTADAVVLALPPAPAARLLAGVAPGAAAALQEITTASVALVTLAYPRAQVAGLPPGSGWLVPAVEGRLTKAVTLVTAKWPHLGGDPVVVRASFGRHGAAHDLHRDDGELVEAARRDLAAAVGLSAAPVDARVTRWGGALPQYAVGHRDRVSRVRAAVADLPGLAVCGATYDGIGIAACIGSATRAAAQVADALRQAGQSSHV